jgi:outer membrane protein
MENRPDVSAARAEAEAANEGTTVAKGGHWPTIDAVGNYYLKRPGILDDIKWDVSFRLSFPLFSGGTVKAEVGEAAAKSSQAELELARARREAGEEIRSLYETIQARIEQLKFLKQSTELAQKNVAVSQKEFRRGLIRNIDVQLALSDYRSARRTLDQTHFASQLDLLRLEIAAAMHPEGETP